MKKLAQQKFKKRRKILQQKQQQKRRSKMHSITNLFKLNELTARKDYNTLSLGDLESNLKKCMSLKSNEKLMATLKDKGEKLSAQIKLIEVN